MSASATGLIDMPYVIRLWTGETLPDCGWDQLEPELARSCGLSVPELRRRIGGGGGPGPDAPNLTCNETIGILWWHIYVKPRPFLCSKRWRRHTTRTFTDWQDWRAPMPDREGGDWR
jgi:hypothetical protein